MQERWVEHNKKYNRITITDWNNLNVTNGGECCIFELLFKLKKAFKKSGQYNDKVEELCRTLKPDFMQDKTEMSTKILLDYSILKIINKVAKLGKDIKTVFESWDQDKNGWRK